MEGELRISKGSVFQMVGEATRTETCTDTRYRQQIRVGRTQTTRHNLMFEQRV